jgi:hypothetical protein
MNAEPDATRCLLGSRVTVFSVSQLRGALHKSHADLLQELAKTAATREEAVREADAIYHRFTGEYRGTHPEDALALFHAFHAFQQKHKFSGAILDLLASHCPHA